MTSILAFAILLTGSSQEDGRFGKTDSQILSMGRKNWLKFAAEGKMGGSTLGYVTAESVYGDALGARTDRILGQTALAKRVVSLRRDLAEFTNCYIAIGRGMTGGGTMWSVISASRMTDIEELLASAAEPKPSPGIRVRDADVLREFGQVRQKIGEKRKVFEEFKATSNVPYGTALQYYVDSLTVYKSRIRPVVYELPPGTANRVRSYCLDVARLKEADPN